MPLLPNPRERFLFLSLNLAPAPLFDLFSAAFRAVLAGLEPGVFDANSLERWILDGYIYRGYRQGVIEFGPIKPDN